MSTSRNGWGRLIVTPFGQARINDAGLVMWAEWEVWSHAVQMVEAGLWTSKPSGRPTRQRTEFYVLDVTAD